VDFSETNTDPVFVWAPGEAHHRVDGGTGARCLNSVSGCACAEDALWSA
jgi:hypothetical protein